MFSSYWTDIVFTLELLQVSNLIFNKEIEQEFKSEILTFELLTIWDYINNARATRFSKI